MNGPAHALARLVVVGAAVVMLIGCSGSTATFPSEDKLTPGLFFDAESRALQARSAIQRQVYPKGLTLTETAEGFVAHLYNDAARYCSIAYGHLVKKAPCDGTEPFDFREGVTESQGADLLAHDMMTAEQTVLSTVVGDLSDGQYAALCDFVYNVGSRNFQGSTLLRVVNTRELERVPGEFRRWVRAGGREWPGLRTRREHEIDVFFDGMIQPRIAIPEENLPTIDIRAGETAG
jgi:GH24 family phage-related lysozyme (muramidase)